MHQLRAHALSRSLIFGGSARVTGRTRKGEESPDSAEQETRSSRTGSVGKSHATESATEKDSPSRGDGEMAV